MGHKIGSFLAAWARFGTVGIFRGGCYVAKFSRVMSFLSCALVGYLGAGDCAIGVVRGLVAG